jgi:hypothetical protein
MALVVFRWLALNASFIGYLITCLKKYSAQVVKALIGKWKIFLLV